MKSLLLVGTGGFIGSLARYIVQLVMTKYFPSPIPFGTLSVNILGCFLIGLFIGFSGKGNLASVEWRLFIATGLCGGFTTFSAFSADSMKLMSDGAYMYSVLYISGSIILGLSATIAGLLLTKII